MLVNPDHKMTEEQERLSQRGLSFVAERDADMIQPPVLDNISGDEEEGHGSLLLPADNNDRDEDGAQ
jgi:hypothetical protein